MKDVIYYSAGNSQALKYAVATLQQKNRHFSPMPDETVTHLLLDAPHRAWENLPAVLSLLPPDVTIIGGNLHHPALAAYKTVDLLQDPIYLAKNANITAHCAIKLALNHLPITLYACPVLVIGWGRIGKCLAHLLKQMGACVTVAARKETDQAMVLALGSNASDTACLKDSLSYYRVIFNTVPTMVLDAEDLQCCRKDCLKLELASLPGMGGDDILCARGLPNQHAPESSGELIAQSILRLCE